MAGFKPGQSGNPNGRPPTAAGAYRREIKAARDLMGGALVPVTEALLDAAKGHHILMGQAADGSWQRITSEGVASSAIQAGLVRVYLADPDLRAILAVHDRIMGRVAQPANAALREVIENAIADHDRIAEIIERHVPAEHLGAIITDIRAIREHRRQAAAVLGGHDATA